MKNALQSNYISITILSLSLLGLLGCTKDPSLNSKPIVKVSNNKIVNIGETVKLHAAASDKDKEDILTYLWRIAAKPKGSKLSLTDATKTDISFKADKKGTYYFDFIAKDEYVSSESKRVIVIASSIIGTWTADLSKTKEEAKLNENETEELVETLSTNYKFVFLENGKIEGDENASWKYNKNGRYQLNGEKDIKIIKENQLFIINKLESGKELKFYYKRALKK